MTTTKDQRVPTGLPELRSKIRDIDDRILGLVAERLEVAKEIGRVKLTGDLPVKDFRVERDVIERATTKARELGIYDELAKDLARLLIRYAVAAQDEFHTQSKRQASQAAKEILIVGGRGRMGLWLSEFFDSFGHVVRHFDPVAKSPQSSDERYPLCTNLGDAAVAHDVIVVASPISETARLIREITKTETRALVFDICSLKSPLTEAIAEAEASGIKITSVHPMFGPQVKLLAGRNIIFCDTGSQENVASARSLFEDTTAHLVTLPLAKHDELMGYVLGLSHLTNLVFARVLSESGVSFQALRDVASTTFNAQLDVVNSVVDENPELYFEIQKENSFTPELIKKIDHSLNDFRAVIEGAKSDTFRSFMKQSRDYLKS